MNSDRRAFLRAGLTVVAAASAPGLARSGFETAAQSEEEWKNWAGSVKWTPRSVVRPKSTAEVVGAVKTSLKKGETLRVAGTGHSFTPLCATDGTTLLLSQMKGIESIDTEGREATVLAGTKLYELAEPLREAGLAMETLPDIDRQTVGGALATATHGTGKSIQSLSALVTGATVVTGDGSVIEIGPGDKDRLLAVQASLGALGVVTRVKLRLVPAFRLHETTSIVPFEEAISQLDSKVNGHRHFEFFWVSERDACLFKTLDPTEEAEDLERFDDESKLTGERIGHSGDIFTHSRTVRFNEIEYSVPLERGPDCWREIRQLMLTKHKDVLWPLEYRTVAPEPAFLSMFEGDETRVTLSLHQAASAPVGAFFSDAEAIFRNHQGRPHWGKIHTLERKELERLYPNWQQFEAVRKEMDPEGRFLPPYLKTLFT